jgi:succinoglycan biosynthesis transport protein ExoP
MKQQNEMLIDLNSVFETLRNGRWILMWLTAFGIAVASYIAFVRAVPRYNATAVLALETQVQKISGINGIVSDMPLAGYSNELVLFTELEVFKSRFLMGDVVRKLDLLNRATFKPSAHKPGYLAYLFPKNAITFDTSKNEDQDIGFAIDRLLTLVDVKLIPNSFAFQISAHSLNPHEARELANTIALLYIERQLNTKHEATRQATRWLTQRVDELKKDLERNETRVRVFDAKTALLTEEDLLVREIKLKEMRSRAKLMQASRDQMMNLIMVQSNDPAVQFKSANATIVSQVRVSNSSKLHRTDEQLQRINSAISSAADEIYAQANDLQTLSQIRREADASKTLYEFFLTRLKEISIQQGIQRADSRLLSPAEFPVEPISPKKRVMLSIGGILGLLGGIVIVFLWDATRRNFHTSSELANAFGLPVLGEIPRITMGRGASMRDVLDANIASSVGDAIRNLRTGLISDAAKSGQTLMVCSALSGEYKTTYAVMLAQKFGALGRRVLLLECDLRFSNYDVIFGQSSGGTLHDILEDQRPLDQVILTQEDLGFDVLRADGDGKNPADILASDQFSQMMGKLRLIYDVIIIDTPPLLLFPDARIVAQHCDQMILNVRAGVTRHDDVQQALDIMRNTKANIAGLVLGGFDPRKQSGNRLQRERSRYVQSRIQG